MRRLISIGSPGSVASRARGELHKLFLDIDPAAVTARDLDELQGIYRRYGGDLTQLESLAVTVKENDDADD